MNKSEQIAYYSPDYATMDPAARARMEEDLMRHYFTPRYQCTPFDPAELVDLAKAQLPMRPQVAEALARCTEQWRKNDLYAYFIDPKSSGLKRCVDSFFLKCPRHGELLLDTDAEGAIIGVEYLTEVMRVENGDKSPPPVLRIVHRK